MTRIISVRSVQTDKDVQFTTALAQDAGENEDIPTGLEVKECGLVTVVIESDQNLNWELWFSSKACATTFGNADQDLDGYLGTISFTASTDAKQSGDTPTHYYYNKELSGPIILRDEVAGTKFNLHMRLVNRSATAKNAGATGKVVVKLWLDVGIR